jgi:Na+-driven multidrug efflux pump
MKYGSAMSVVTGCVFAVVYFCFNELLVRLFMDSSGSAEAVQSGADFLRTVSLFYCFIGVKLVGDGILRGAGRMKLFMVATFADLILRVILAYVLSPSMGPQGIWTSWPIGWCVATVLSVIFYLIVIKRTKPSVV